MSVVRNWSGSGKIAIVSEPFHFKEIYNMFWKAKDMTFQGMLLDFPLFNIMARTMFFCEWCLELKWVRKSRDCERTLQLPGDLQYVLEVWRQDLSGDGFGFYISSILQPGQLFCEWISKNHSRILKKSWSGKWKSLSRNPGDLGCLVCFVVVFLMKLFLLVQNSSTFS